MMSLDWHKPLETTDGRYAVLLPSDGLTQKRRVHIARDGRRFTELKDAANGTTWHYNEDGSLDAAGSGWALRNAAGTATGYRAAA